MNFVIMDRHLVLQFLLILLTVPLQLLLLSKWSNKNAEPIKPPYRFVFRWRRFFFTRLSYCRLSNSFTDFVRYFSPKTWFQWFISFAIDVPVSFTPSLHKQRWKDGSESPAVEVLHLREQYGYFASKILQISIDRISCPSFQ